MTKVRTKFRSPAEIQYLKTKVLMNFTKTYPRLVEDGRDSKIIKRTNRVAATVKKM